MWRSSRAARPRAGRREPTLSPVRTGAFREPLRVLKAAEPLIDAPSARAIAGLRRRLRVHAIRATPPREPTQGCARGPGCGHAAPWHAAARWQRGRRRFLLGSPVRTAGTSLPLPSAHLLSWLWSPMWEAANLKMGGAARDPGARTGPRRRRATEPLG